MSDHLPECLLPDFDKGVWVCCCAQLRACEQRILLSKPNIELSALYGYEAGRVDGINEAREAVAALDNCPECSADAALAAIDALRTDTAPRISTGYDPTATDNRP